MDLLHLFLSLSFMISQVFSANILFYHTVATSSHRTSIYPLVEKLVERGHKITYIFPVKLRLGNLSSVEEITPSKMTPLVEEFVGNYDINHRLNHTTMDIFFQIFSKCLDFCEAFYDSPEVKEWLSRPNLRYDLIMIDQSFGECAYGLVEKFKAKHIIFVPVIPAFIWDGFGVVPETSSVPGNFLNYKPGQMSLFNRLLNTLDILVFRLAFLDYMNKVGRIVKSKMEMPGMADIIEYERNTSLVMLNNHFVDDYPYSLPPMFVQYSGLWCSRDKLKEIKPLPKEIREFLKDSEFIYVSFGSSVIASAMPVEVRQVFFEAFGKLSHLKFLWRWTGDIPEDKPGNVLLMNWFPQHDILASGKIKGFITQAGRPSAQEGLCHAVPMITIPIFVDQDYNAHRLEYIRASISLDINTLTSDILRESVESLVKNVTYKNRMKELSRIFRDRPLDPLDNAVYWTEYVLRHDTWLMKPLGIEQRWWQRRLWDVYALLLLIVLISSGVGLIIGYYAVKCCVRRMLKSKIKSE